MDYEYKLLHERDMHNRCCGGRAWCVQVQVLMALHNIPVIFIANFFV